MTTTDKPPSPAVGAGAGRAGGTAVRLGSIAELARHKRTVVVAGGVDLLVLHVRRRFTVLENRCPHLGLPLDDARLVGRTLTCSAHGFKYSLADGGHIPGWRCPAGGAGSLRLFPTHVEDGWLFAMIDTRSADQGPP